MKQLKFKRIQTAAVALVLLISLGLLPGCRYYYKVVTTYRVGMQDLKRCDSMDKYFILHQGKEVWHLNRFKLGERNISGTLEKLPSDRYQFKSNNPFTANRYKYSTGDIVLDQVHLHMWDTIIPRFKTGDSVVLDVSAFRRGEAYVKAVGKTTVSWVMGAVIGTVSAAGVAAIAAGIYAIATKTSCPLIYMDTDKGYVFAGEIFGGALFASLERSDYLPLPGFEPSGGRYTIKIANGLPEVQYINLAELRIVSHPDSVTVLPDRHGKLHTLARPRTPLAANTSGNTGLIPVLEKKDGTAFHFDEEPSQTGDSNAVNTVLLTFRVPAKADTGKLVIRAGNSMWGDYTYQEFSKLFGKKYGQWIRKQGKKPADAKIQWKKDQRFTLVVSVETGSGWQFVDYFDLIGPLGLRDMVMPVDLSQAIPGKTAGNDRTVRIRIESGFKLWDLDYAAMDFTDNLAVTTECVKPASAVTETGKDVRMQITGNDDAYYIQYRIGEEAIVSYPATPDIPGMKKSVFLHAGGYYTPVRDYPGQPDRKKLQTFLVPGRFSRFSYDNYTEFTNRHMDLVSYPDVP